MEKFPAKLKIYLGFVFSATIASIFVFINSTYTVNNTASAIDTLFFALLMAITESFTVVYKTISFSTSFAIQLCSYIVFGPLVTLIVIVVGFSFRIMKVDDEYQHIFNTPIFVTVFNLCVLILSLVYANFVFGGRSFPMEIATSINSIIEFCIVIFFLNNIFISILNSILTRKKFIYSFLSNIRLAILNIIVIAPFGIMLAFAHDRYGNLGVALLLFPILLARYTFLLYIDAKSQYAETVDALMRAVEARDKYTEGHSQRVADIVEKISRELKFSDRKIEHLRMASMMHDVGKIGIDDSILNKPGKLSDEEYNTIKAHPEIGYNILKDIKNLYDTKNIVRHHHERYDGKGYPDSKNADELGIDVFIVQLADSIDAMATDRPYRKALNQGEILSEVKKNSGTQFHPKVVDAYFRIIEKENNLI